MTQFDALRPKHITIKQMIMMKKRKIHKKCVINYLEKSKLDVDNLRENHTKFIRNNTLILKLQQRCRSEKHNLFTEEVKEIVLSVNDDRRIRSINFIKTYE